MSTEEYGQIVIVSSDVSILIVDACQDGDVYSVPFTVYKDSLPRRAVKILKKDQMY